MEAASIQMVYKDLKSHDIFPMISVCNGDLLAETIIKKVFPDCQSNRCIGNSTVYIQTNSCRHCIQCFQSLLKKKQNISPLAFRIACLVKAAVKNCKGSTAIFHEQMMQIKLYYLNDTAGVLFIV